MPTRTSDHAVHSSAATPPRELDIDLLYLDATTCGRCTGTEDNLEVAVTDVSRLLRAAGIEVTLHKVHVDTAALAREHRFVSSPTIRVNGHDVALGRRESSCKDCSEIAGCGGGGVDCRVWVWQGREHVEAPKGMIVDALLRAAYGPASASSAPAEPYVLPENLRRFHEATAARPAGASGATPSSPCATPAGATSASGRAAPAPEAEACCAAPAPEEACCVKPAVPRGSCCASGPSDGGRER